MTFVIKLMLVAAFFSFGGDAKTYLDNQEFMDLKTATEQYGKATFSAKKFHNSSSEGRAKMAVSLIEGNIFVGKKPAEVKKALGEFTGYFFSDNIPAYLIQEGWNAGKDTWQLVFLLDESGKVNNVRIHKNCCNKK